MTITLTVLGVLLTIYFFIGIEIWRAVAADMRREADDDEHYWRAVLILVTCWPGAVRAARRRR